MSENNEGYSVDERFVRSMIESALRIGLIALLLIWSFNIVSAFLMPIVWGGILAIAFMPLITKMEGPEGNKRTMLVTLFSILMVLIILGLVFATLESIFYTFQHLREAFQAGELHVPPPKEGVQDWPIIGERLHAGWTAASANLSAFVGQYHEQLLGILQTGLGSLGSTVSTAFMFVASFIIAGIFMAYADSAEGAFGRIGTRIFGDNGSYWTRLVIDTVRSVSVGVVGVAVIQGILVGIGLFAFGVPAAGVWAFGTMLLAIAQLPALIILIPIIIWGFSVADTTSAIIFAIYSVIAGASDAFLKPLLMGRGVDVPMPVILVGAIGGMIVYGIVGLFVGAVVLAVAWELMEAWLKQAPESGLTHEPIGEQAGAQAED